MDLYYCFYQNPIEKKKEKAGHQVGYALLSYALENKYGISILPRIEKGRYGKPYFPEYPRIHFNISHCDGMAACAIAKQEIGIDVERKRRITQALVNKALTENEREELQQYKKEEVEMGFLRYWTLKESFIKAIGRGLSFPLCEIEFSLNPDPIVGNLSSISSNQNDWQFFQTVLEKDYLLAVCFHEEEEMESACHLQEIKTF